MKNKIFLISIIIITLVSASCKTAPDSVQSPQNKQKEFVEFEDNTGEYVGYNLVGESDTLTLEFNGDDYSIRITDKRNNYAWNSAVDVSKIDTEPNEFWLNNIKSLIQVVYINKDSNVNDPQTASILGDVNNMRIKRINNGISMDIFFVDLKISVTLNIEVVDDSIMVTIPDDKIFEPGDNYVVSIYLLPFLGASKDTDKGFYLYPNGTGEIYNFKPQNERLNAMQAFRLPVYSEDKVNMTDFTNNYNAYQKRPSVLFPVFGVKTGENAFLSTIVQGQYNSAINVVPSGVYVGVNRIYSELVFRNYSDATAGGLNAEGAGKKIVTNLYDKNIIPGTRKVVFTFLCREDANYSAMARVYRKYLIDNKLINNAIKQNEKMPISLEIVNGIMKNYVFFKKYIPLTTYKQVGSMADKLAQTGVKDVIVSLEGWSTSGIGAYPQTNSPESNLGGKAAFVNMQEIIEQSKYKLMLSTNLFDLDSKIGRFSISADTATDNTFSQYTNFKGNRFILNPASALVRNSKLLKDMSSFKINGISYDKFGEFIFTSANKSNPASREQTANAYSQILQDAKGRYDNAAVIGGNSYVLKNTTLIKDLPLFTTLIPLSDEQVPFYPMAIHGKIPYASSPVNLFYDNRLQLLKLIEYGYVPSFKMTYGNSNILKDTEYNWLFTSQFDNWKENIKEIYEKVNVNLSKVYSEDMLSHEKVGNNLFKVRYENAAIYINYNDSDVVFDGKNIKAQDFLIVEVRR